MLVLRARRYSNWLTGNASVVRELLRAGEAEEQPRCR